MKGNGPGPGIAVPGAHRFSHEAMATLFEIVCAGGDRAYARQAAQAAFDLIDRLERELSRFIENSDISRINALPAGEACAVCPWTMECLQIARQAWVETGGAFDVSIGSGMEKVELIPAGHAVRILAEVSEDVANAANWYDQEGYVGLGERFERAFYSHVEHLQDSGEIYRTVYSEFRRIFLRPFPYALYYRYHGLLLVVSLVIHTARDPKRVRALLRERRR